jgi:hypothetical protein
VWVFNAQWGNSHSPQSAPITLHQPVPGATVEQCKGQPTMCAMTGGVDSAVLDLTLPASSPTSVVLTWAINDVLQAGSQTVQLNTLTMPSSGPLATGTAFLPVPSAPDGATWKIFAQYGGNTTAVTPITLHAPTITAALGCGSACALKPGTMVGLIVTAPARSQVTTATVSTTVDGVPSVTNASLALSEINVGANTISGTLTLPVPNASGSQWQINATVGAYPASAIVNAIGQ